MRGTTAEKVGHVIGSLTHPPNTTQDHLLQVELFSTHLRHPTVRNSTKSTKFVLIWTMNEILQTTIVIKMQTYVRMVTESNSYNQNVSIHFRVFRDK